MTGAPAASPADRCLALRRDAAAGRLGPVCILAVQKGEKEKDAALFLIAKIEELVIARMRGDPAARFNIDVFTGGQADLRHLLGVARTPPLFGARRLTMLRGAAEIKEKEGELLAAYVGRPVGSTLLVVSVSSAKVPKALADACAAAGCLHHVESIREQGLRRWIAGLFKEAGVAISPDAVAAIAQLAGGDLVAIEDAREKLALYARGRAAVEPRDVEELLLPTRSAEIYEFADRLWARDAPGALAQLARLEAQKTEPLYVNTILAMQARGLVKTKSLLARGVASPARIAAETGMREFFARKSAQQAGGFSAAALERALAVCTRTDAELKSLRMGPWRIIEQAVLKILSLQG